MKSYDVIIGGAGISGLLLASHLSSKYSVLILEKEVEKPSLKYWLTTRSCLRGNEHLSGGTDSYYESLKFISHDHLSYNLEGSYILWNSDALSNILKSIIRKNGGEILYSHRFYSYEQSKQSLVVLANELRLQTKLFIDCMGYASPLILSKGVIEIIGYHLLHGSILQIKEPVNPICIANVIIDEKPSYFEVFPRTDGKAYVALISPVASVMSMDKLIKDFHFIVSQSYYSKHFSVSNEDQSLGGIVPVGIPKKRAFDRIFFFGESAQMNPASSGTCLTILLESYKAISHFLDQRLTANQLSKRHLEEFPVTRNSFSQKFQMYLFKEMLKWKSDDFAMFLTILNHLDDDSVNRFLFGEITLKDFLRAEILHPVLSTGNFMWLKPFIKSIL